jgi:molecular chaperone DnaK
MIYTAEKSLTDHKDAISAEVKASVEEKVKELREVKDKDDNEVIKAKTQALSSEMQKIGEEMQKNAPQANAENAPGEQPKDEGNIRDAEAGDSDEKTN